MANLYEIERSNGQNLPTATDVKTDIQSVISATLKTVAESSGRVYGQTYRLWIDWCNSNEIDPLNMTFANVSAFLEEQDVSKSTRQRQLSAMRKLAEMLSILDYANPLRDASYKSLKKLKVRHMGNTTSERDRHALTPAQVDKILRVWSGDTLTHKRNKAIIAVLFMTGMRRSEVASLQWQDIDLEQGIIHIRAGKGDKARDVAMSGSFAIDALLLWKDLCGTRHYVFPSLAKGGKFGEDAPTHSQTIYDVVKQTEKQSGIQFSPHTARRTFITEALDTGTTLADVQAQAGHTQESTTLRYARPIEAKQRRAKLRLRYG